MFCYLKTLITPAALKLLCYYDSKPMPHYKIFLTEESFATCAACRSNSQWIKHHYCVNGL